MSQVVRKFENSGKIEQSKPELFERSGVGKYNKADLVAGLYRNIGTYIKNNNLSGDRAISFRNSANQFIKGIENGTISMNGDGTFSDATGSMASSGKFDKNWMGRKKDTTNNAFNLVGNYALDYIDQMQQYTEPAAKPKEKFNANKFMEDAISKEWYGGNTIDYNNWFKNRGEQDRNALMGGVWNNANYNQMFQSYDWSGTNIKSAEDLATLGRRYGAAISNNTLDNDDYNSFAALGGSNLDRFLKVPTEPVTPIVEGQQGKVDTGWKNSEYDRTIDDKGQYHIYKKGTNEEVRGILPGNAFEGLGNKYAFDGNFYDDTNLPEQYRQDITRARQAQLNEYTRLSDNNPFTKMLKGQGYNYITNLSQFASGIGDNILYGVYSDPSNVSGQIGFYLKNPNTGKASKGSVEYNKSLGQYQFVGTNGNVINLGEYNTGGTRTNQGTSFVNYSDMSENNRDNLFSAWMRNSEIANPASEAYKMVQSTLSKWITSKDSPFVSYNGQYQWKSGNDVMNVRKGPNGQWQWNFNKGFDDKILDLSGYKKEGGIIAAQLGTKFTKVDDIPSLQRPQTSEKQAEKNQKAHQSFTERTNVSLGDNKDITDAGGVLKTSDKVRLGAAMADLASIGLGFVPGANLASTGIGVGASLTEFGADWAGDGLDWGDVGRLGMNLGMDALSLIPAGKALKATKALGKIRKSIPLIMTALNATNLLDPALREEYSKTLSKLVHGDIKKLNTGDFKNLSAIASTVLMGKNYAQSRKGYWNSSTVPSGKRRVTAMIDGKQQTLEVDEAFFQNIKGKNQVTELKSKFAAEYNKNNKLEGDKAIAPDKVAIDTKYFGRRPQSEKVEGTREEGNWLSNSFIGKHLVGYRDPSVVRGNENIPFSDAWFLKSNKVSTTPVQRQKQRQSEEVTTPLLMLPAPGQTHRVFTMGAGKPKVPQDVTNPTNLRKPGSHTDRAVPVGGTPVQSPDANAVRTVNAINSILEPFTPKPKNLPAVIPASRNAEKVVASKTIQPSQRLDQFIEGQIPGGRQFGRQRAKTEREYRDVFHPAAEREYNQIWDEAVRGRKDFGYEEVIPRRSPYAPPTPTEVYTTPQQPMKDSNARYLWELINKSKPNTDHIKRSNPPRKKSNKKKKTSKDDKVTKKADGGLIQFLQDGKPVGRIKAKDMSGWNRDATLDNYNWLEDYDRWAKEYDGADDVADAYMTIFNGGEDIYDNLTTKTGDYFGGKYNYSVQDPLAKHRQITFRGSNQGFDDLIRKGIVGHGTTEGDSGYDIFAGDRTGNRTLSRGLQQRHVERFNSQLSQRGLELYDKGNGTYRLRRLQQKPRELPEVVVTADAPKTPAATNPSVIDGVTSGKGKGFNLGVMPEDVIALGRMVGGLATNNRAAKLYKEGLKPTLLDTFENTVPLQGNFHAKALAEQQAGNVESMAARPRTSDASLQLAGELEASNRAGQARFQGGLQDADMFYKTRMLGQQESDAAKARRVQVANQNRGSMNAIDAAKKQIDSARVTANYQQVLAPYMAGIENRFRQNTAMKRQFGMEQAQNAMGTEYDANYARIMKQYGEDPVRLNEELTKLRNKASQDMLTYKKQLLGSPWMFSNVPTTSDKTPYYAKGSKLTYKEKAMLQSAKDFNKRLSDDNKLMHKDIMEAKREHNKLIANMSALTASLIKRGMSL